MILPVATSIAGNLLIALLAAARWYSSRFSAGFSWNFFASYRSYVHVNIRKASKRQVGFATEHTRNKNVLMKWFDFVLMRQLYSASWSPMARGSGKNTRLTNLNYSNNCIVKVAKANFHESLGSFLGEK